MSEPDRYDKQGVETWRALRIMTEADAAPIIAAALRQAADEALKRAAYIADSYGCDYAAKNIRALASPAAAPAAEPERFFPGAAELMGEPPSEPVAPAKDQLRDPVALLKRARPYVHSQWCRPGIRSVEIDRAEELLNDIDAALADGGEGK